jgi:hypothetical protein
MKERVLLFVVVLCSGLLGGWLGLMVLDNEPPYVYDEANSRIVPDPAPQGAMIVADWGLVSVKRQCPATVQRIFRDHSTGRVVSTLDTTEASRAVQVGDNRLPRSFQLPPDLPAVTDYSALVCFQCNLIQTLVRPLCVSTPKITFRVIQ